jgi:hypothetical protein
MVSIQSLETIDNKLRDGKSQTDATRSADYGVLYYLSFVLPDFNIMYLEKQDYLEKDDADILGTPTLQ